MSGVQGFTLAVASVFVTVFGAVLSILPLVAFESIYPWTQDHASIHEFISASLLVLAIAGVVAVNLCGMKIREGIE